MFAWLEEAACLENGAYTPCGLERVEVVGFARVRSRPVMGALGCGLGEVKGLASEPRPCRRANLISSFFLGSVRTEKKKPVR